jgi:TPR repeat protein
MASLTPLSKGLIGLAVVGAMASAVWHLVLKERMGGGPASDWQTSSTPTQTLPNSTLPTSAPALQTPTTAAPNPPTAAAITPISGQSATENFDTGRKLMANGDFAQARKHLEAAVNAGDGAAACLVGEMTLKGQGGIPANQDAAAKLFQLAQSRGSICFASGQ